MAQLKALEKKIQSVKEIESVVSTMKSLAAVNINNFQNAADAAEDYLYTIEKGLQVTLQDKDERLWGALDIGGSGIGKGYKGTLFVVVGSEQGMCGSFNQSILDRLEVEIEFSQPEIISIGSKMNILTENGNYRVLKSFGLSTSTAHLDDLAAELQIEIYRRIRNHGFERVLIVFNKMNEGESIFTSEFRSLHPLNRKRLDYIFQRKWESKGLPIILMDRTKLLRMLTNHYIGGIINLALINSLASENAARLASMQAAERNIKDKKNNLYSAYNRVRQESITSELLDIVGGFEVLS